jgi:DNA polymerase-3 subunit alpha
MTKTAVECLIKAGAFDALPGHRAQLLAAMEELLQAAASTRRERERGQESLFGEQGDAARSEVLPTVPEWSRSECLAQERDLLGVYISDHPVRQAQAALRDARVTPTSELPELGDRREVTIGGIITSVVTRVTKQNKPMAQVTIEDLDGSVTATVFPRWYDACRPHLEKDRLVILKGRTNVRESRSDQDDAPPVVELQVEEVHPLTLRTTTRLPSVNIRLHQARRNDLTLLKQILTAYPGDARLCFHVDQGGQVEKVLAGMKVQTHPKMLEEVKAVLGRSEGTVWVD